MSQTEQGNRLFDDKFDYRYDPFTQTDESISVTEESHVIPGSSPYYVQLLEVPAEDDPSTITIIQSGQLNEDLDISETGVDVVRGADWATGDTFTIDSEEMYVDSVSSNTLTVQRGYNGTSAATHNQYENVDTGTLDANGETYLAHDSTTDFIAAGARIGDIFENTTNSETATITDILTKTNQHDTLYFSTGTATSNDSGDSWVVKRPRLLKSTVEFTEVAVSPAAGEFQVHYGTAAIPYKRGLIRFHEDDKNKTVLVDYDKTGAYNWAEHINDIQDVITKGRLSQVPRYGLKTGKGNVNGFTTSILSVTMQDYTFFPNAYTSPLVKSLSSFGTNNADYIGRFTIDNPTNYDIYYRYITSSDEPFIYAIQNKTTGEIEQLWMCEDPPPAYWGHDLPPDNFEAPLIMYDEKGNKLDISDKNEIIIFKYNMDAYNELTSRFAKEKTEDNLPFKILSEKFDYDNKSKLFKPKNLTMI